MDSYWPGQRKPAKSSLHQVMAWKEQFPDAIAKRIITNTIAPAFKQEQYYQGLDEATTEIIRRASGEYKADPDTNSDGGARRLYFYHTHRYHYCLHYNPAEPGRWQQQ